MHSLQSLMESASTNAAAGDVFISAGPRFGHAAESEQFAVGARFSRPWIVVAANEQRDVYVRLQLDRQAIHDPKL